MSLPPLSRGWTSIRTPRSCAGRSAPSFLVPGAVIHREASLTAPSVEMDQFARTLLSEKLPCALRQSKSRPADRVWLIIIFWFSFCVEACGARQQVFPG